MDFCGVGVGLGVGAGVGLGVGFGVGAGVGLGVGFGVATGLEELPPEELPPEEPLLPPEELPPVEGLLEELLPLLPVEGLLEELLPLLPVEGLLDELPLLPVEGLLVELPLLPEEGLLEELLPETLLVGSASGFADSFTSAEDSLSASTIPMLEEGSGVSATSCPALHAVSSMANVRAAIRTVFFIHLTSRFFFVEIISTDQIMVNSIYRAVPGSSDGPPSLWEH